MGSVLQASVSVTDCGGARSGLHECRLRCSAGFLLCFVFVAGLKKVFKTSCSAKTGLTGALPQQQLVQQDHDLHHRC